MRILMQRLLRDESGATAMEYGLIVSLISLLVIAAITAAGTNMWTTLNRVSTALRNGS